MNFVKKKNKFDQLRRVQQIKKPQTKSKYFEKMSFVRSIYSLQVNDSKKVFLLIIIL
jgi:hypothetical protein